jgi:hypothetical protein
VFIEVLRQCDDNGERTEPIVHLFVACDHYGLVDLRGCVLIKEFKIFFYFKFLCLFCLFIMIVPNTSTLDSHEPTPVWDRGSTHRRRRIYLRI